MAIGRVNAPLGDYFVGDTIKPEHIKIELDGHGFRRQETNEYTKNREYSKKLIVSKSDNIYLFFTSGFDTFCYKFDKNLKVIWRKSIEGSSGPYELNVYYNYHKDILYIVDKGKIIVTDMDVNVITEIQHDDIFTWDDKGNTYLISQSYSTITLKKLNSSFSEEWSRLFAYGNTLTNVNVFYRSDGYIYIPGKKINTKTRTVEESFDFGEGITNAKQNIACYTTGPSKIKVESDEFEYEIDASIWVEDAYISDKGEVIWLYLDTLFKAVNPGILVGVSPLAGRDRKLYNIAGNDNIVYIAGAESFSSSAVKDYGFISSYKTGGIDKITITGRD